MSLLIIPRVALRALGRNKARSDLTMLGIVTGVAAVIAMVSIGQGAQASVREQIAHVGTNLLFLSGLVPKMSEGSRLVATTLEVDR